MFLKSRHAIFLQYTVIDIAGVDIGWSLLLNNTIRFTHSCSALNYNIDTQTLIYKKNMSSVYQNTKIPIKIRRLETSHFDV